MVRVQHIVRIVSKREDQFVSRFRIAIDACTAQRRDIISLHNWLTGTGSVNQEEASFLRHEADLMSISSRPDKTQSYFQTCIVKAGARLRHMLHKVLATT